MRTKIIILMVFPILALLETCSAQGGFVGTDSAPSRKVEFPDGFYFGAGSASYQIEGAWNVGGKSQSIWDVFTHKPGHVKDNSTGDNACKSYEYYKRDTQMLNYLGVDFYRFSISWPRILPTGYPDKINKEGIDHYNNVINDLLKNDIRPFVTMYHWDLPQSLQDLGGWANPKIVGWFKDYARVLFDNFGNRVKLWGVINEPAQVVMGYNSKNFAPAKDGFAGVDDYLAAKHIVLANAEVWHMYDKEYRRKQKALVGIVLSTDYFQGLTDSPEDAQAANDCYDFFVGMYAHPIFSKEGGFPPRVKKLVAERSRKQKFDKSRLPEFTEEERKFCLGTSDFYGFNHYSTQYVTRKGYQVKNTGNFISMEADLGVITSSKDYPKLDSDRIAVVPHGIRGALKYIKETYGDIQILITENGIAQATQNDSQKIDYLNKYLFNVIAAMSEDGVNVYGYSAWSLMDSFEWKDGYTLKFGLFKVDFKSPERKRQTRLSAVWYKNLVDTMALDPDYVPKYEKVEF